MGTPIRPFCSASTRWTRSRADKSIMVEIVRGKGERGKKGRKENEEDAGFTFSRYYLCSSLIPFFCSAFALFPCSFPDNPLDLLPLVRGVLKWREKQFKTIRKKRGVTSFFSSSITKSSLASLSRSLSLSLCLHPSAARPSKACKHKKKEALIMKSKSKSKSEERRKEPLFLFSPPPTSFTKNKKNSSYELIAASISSRLLPLVSGTCALTNATVARQTAAKNK